MLSVVIPVYNEEAGLRAALEATGRYLASLGGGGHEIVVCDDGSKDGSAKLAESLAGHWPIRVMRWEKNRGKGAVVRDGMLAAKGARVLFMDADLSTPLDELPRFLAALDAGADVAIATRKHHDARIERPQPWHRVALGRNYTRLANALLGLRVSDFTCGFKLFTSAAAQAVFSRQRLDRWSFDAEIVYLSHRLGLRVAELPVRWADRPDSRVRVGSAVWKSLLELLEIRRAARRGEYR